MKISLLTLCIVTVFIAAQAQKKTTAQPPVQKMPLDHSVYDFWKEIPYKALTNDGAFAVYTLNPQEGDGRLVFHNLTTNAIDSIPRGTEAALSWDSHYAVLKIKPQLSKVKELRRQKKKKEDLPKDSLGIYSFQTRKTEKIADVRSFKIPEKAGGWAAWQLEAAKDAKVPKGKKPKKNSDDNGYSLVLRNLATRQDTQFGYVKEYTFARYGQGLLFTSAGDDSTLKAGVYWYDLSAGRLNAVMEGHPKQKFTRLAINEDGTQVAFIADLDTTKAINRFPILYHWKSGTSPAAVLVKEQSAGFPKEWVVSEHYTPSFSKDGKSLYLGSAPLPLRQDTTLLPEEIVNVEVWGWRDEHIYPQQSRQLDNNRKKNYLAVVDLASSRFSQLGRTDIPSIETGDEGNASVALGESDILYRYMSTWDISTFRDLYLINKADGSSKKIAEKVKGNPSLSPKANYVYWFSLPDTAWFAYSVSAGTTVNLTGQLQYHFADEKNDVPDYPSSYGIAGWTNDDQLLIAYDRYDLWALDPQNSKAAVNLTKIGREQRVVFRNIRLDPEERFLDPEKELLLSAFSEETKASGFYTLSLKDGKLTKKFMTEHRYGAPVKSRQSNRLLYTRENFREFPDLWTSDPSLATPKKITDANPQAKNYKWGSVELVNWNSLDNISLQGLLYKPENFDPKKKYPMIVYFYETFSDELHVHYAPFPHRSRIIPSVYASRGYLVFIPDIVYKAGYPGESAHNCVMPGVTSLIAKGFVDEKNIGMQGHSWGGYQSLYLITRTNLFKAAEAGAPVANMISAYGGIRWETGYSRMFQYEHSQSRIGGSFWEKPMQYIENSPIFFADKIQTPLLLLHNDADGAVPWYQGIETYMAMRRLGKPAWMLNYNGEPHWPLKRENRIDFQKRMNQFFDHYLKGAPAPEWMTTGVPAVEKGIKTGY